MKKTWREYGLLLAAKKSSQLLNNSRKTKLNIIRNIYIYSVVLVLQACAIPGFEPVASGRTENAPLEVQGHILGYRPVIEDPPQVDGAPEGAIVSITPALIKSFWMNRAKDAPNDVKDLFGTTPVYTIGVGDVIGVIVYDHPELLPNAGAVISQTSDPTGVSVAPGFIVSATGEISFPYVGRIKMAGLTEIEASDLITQRIAKYIKEPQVTVRIASFRSRRTYLEGEVRQPGIQIFTDVPMTLAEAISRAGGITANGDRSFVTLNRAGKTTVLNLADLQDLGIDASRIPLSNGDIINVRNKEENKVYVMGEVLRPAAVLLRNGKLSLNEALGDVGGLNLLTANAAQIYVIRNANQEKMEIFHLDAKNPTALALADRFSLLPRDVVYVDPVALVKWNRIISLILPAAQIVDLGSQAATR